MTTSHQLYSESAAAIKSLIEKPQFSQMNGYRVSF